jgi:hypothetical protein
MPYSSSSQSMARDYYGSTKHQTGIIGEIVSFESIFFSFWEFAGSNNGYGRYSQSYCPSLFVFVYFSLEDF